MFPIVNPPPSSLPIPSLWVIQPQASSITHRTWTGDSFHMWYYTCFNAIFPKLKDNCIIVLCLFLPSTWICHRYTRVPHPEHPSFFPPHTIPLGHLSAPAPSIQYHALNLDWQFVSYMILYMFQCHSPKSSHPLPLPESKRLFYASVSLLLSCIQGYRYHLSKFHIYALVYCIGIFLSGLLHSIWTASVLSTSLELIQIYSF